MTAARRPSLRFGVMCSSALFGKRRVFAGWTESGAIVSRTSCALPRRH
jgi:hypothetical protein